jgi:glutaconate CoA-transferase subunit B
MSTQDSIYSRQELMAITAARALGDGEVVFVGIGLPNLACNLARRLHAPNLKLVYEAGVFGAVPGRLPLSIGDPCLVSGAALVCSLPEIFLFYLQRGLIDVGFLGAAQIDRHGNINTTVIGSYDRPKVRLPGSGGACEIALLAKKVFVIARQSARSFVERVDFVTSPGFIAGKRPPGAGGRTPARDHRSGHLPLRRGNGRDAHSDPAPGVTYEDVRAACGWEIRPPGSAATTPEPTEAELRILREHVDREGRYLGAGG